MLNSQDGKTLAKSVNVLKPGGRVISISGPPDLAFAESVRGPWFLKLATRILSYGIRKQAKARKVLYSFLFMRAEGGQLAQITPLIESGAIHAVVDRVFPFSATNVALAYVESGRAKGKVVIKVR